MVTDLELFAVVLLFKTDIWVFTSDMGNKWMVFSGNGASLEKVMTLPPANEAGSLYIRHTRDHYEPVSELNLK